MAIKAIGYIDVTRCDHTITLSTTTLQGGGIRIATGKCCVWQYGRRLKRWALDQREIEDLISALQDMLEESDE